MSLTPLSDMLRELRRLQAAATEQEIQIHRWLLKLYTASRETSVLSVLAVPDSKPQTDQFAGAELLRQAAAGPPPPNGAIPRESGSFFNTARFVPKSGLTQKFKTISSLVRDYIAKGDGRTFGKRDLLVCCQEHFNADPDHLLSAISNTVHKLTTTGYIERLARGRYRRIEREPTPFHV